MFCFQSVFTSPPREIFSNRVGCQQVFPSDYVIEIIKVSSHFSISKSKIKIWLSEFQKQRLESSEISKIVNLHNKHREQVASGSKAGFSSASNMLELKWDDELASLAQTQANGLNMDVASQTPKTGKILVLFYNFCFKICFSYKFDFFICSICLF